MLYPESPRWRDGPLDPALLSLRKAMREGTGMQWQKRAASVHKPALVLRALNFPLASDISFEMFTENQHLYCFLPRGGRWSSSQKRAKRVDWQTAEASSQDALFVSERCHNSEAICRENVAFPTKLKIWRVSWAPCAPPTRSTEVKRAQRSGRRRRKSWESGSHSEVECHIFSCQILACKLLAVKRRYQLTLGRAHTSEFMRKDICGAWKTTSKADKTICFLKLSGQGVGALAGSQWDSLQSPSTSSNALTQVHPCPLSTVQKHPGCTLPEEGTVS